MSFASLCVFTYVYPVSFLSKCYRKEVLAVLAAKTAVPLRSRPAWCFTFHAKHHLGRERRRTAVFTGYCGSNILPQSSCTFILQPQRSSGGFQDSSSSDPQSELLLADAKRSSCTCIIFGLYCSQGKMY